MCGHLDVDFISDVISWNSFSIFAMALSFRSCSSFNKFSLCFPMPVTLSSIWATTDDKVGLKVAHFVVQDVYLGGWYTFTSIIHALYGTIFVL